MRTSKDYLFKLTMEQGIHHHSLLLAETQRQAGNLKASE